MRTQVIDGKKARRDINLVMRTIRAGRRALRQEKRDSDESKVRALALEQFLRKCSAAFRTMMWAWASARMILDVYSDPGTGKWSLKRCAMYVYDVGNGRAPRSARIKLPEDVRLGDVRLEILGSEEHGYYVLPFRPDPGGARAVVPMHEVYWFLKEWGMRGRYQEFPRKKEEVPK